MVQKKSQAVTTNYLARCCKVAERTGLEPATPGVTGRYSNQTELPLRLEVEIQAIVAVTKRVALVGAAGLEPATFAL